MNDQDPRRDRLIVRGVVQVAARGLTLGLEQVSLADAAASSGMSQGDAYALWVDGEHDEDPSVIEDRFRYAVAARLLARQTAPDDDTALASTAVEETITSVAAATGDMPPVDQLTPAERGRWLQVMYRAGADANVAMADSSVLWRSFAVLATNVLADPTRSPELYEAWRRSDKETSVRYFNVVSTMASLFGMRLRYCYTGEQFSVALNALSQGFLLRARLESEHHHVERFTGEGGAAESWSLFSVGVEALIRQFFEPIEPGTVDLEHESATDA